MTGRTRPLHRIRSAPSRRPQFRTAERSRSGLRAADPRAPEAATDRQLELFRELVARSEVHCRELRTAHEALRAGEAAGDGAPDRELETALARSAERVLHAEQSHSALLGLLEAASASAGSAPGAGPAPLREVGEAAP